MNTTGACDARYILITAFIRFVDRDIFVNVFLEGCLVGIFLIHYLTQSNDSVFHEVISKHPSKAQLLYETPLKNPIITKIP